MEDPAFIALLTLWHPISVGQTRGACLRNSPRPLCSFTIALALAFALEGCGFGGSGSECEGRGGDGDGGGGSGGGGGGGGGGEKGDGEELELSSHLARVVARIVTFPIP